MNFILFNSILFCIISGLTVMIIAKQKHQEKLLRLNKNGIFDDVKFYKNINKVIL